jgi:GTP cyclohydrolase I
MKSFNDENIISAWKVILTSLGIDSINDSNFKETPQRISKMYYELFAGLLDGDLTELEKHITKTFPSKYKGLVAVKNISVWGTCPHHFLPVEYTVDVGYIPTELVLGVSKLPRVVEVLAQRPVLQEEFTHDIVEYLDRALSPRGVIVQVKGRHHCMIVRGIKQPNTWVTTSDIAGVFSETPSLIKEFYDLA